MESQNQALVIPHHPRANAPEPRNPVEPPSLRRLLLKRKSVRQRACGMIGPIKAIRTSHHIGVHMEFTTIRNRREVWLTPENQTVIAPLPAHVKGLFTDNLAAMVLDLYHSCSVTQPLLRLLCLCIAACFFSRAFPVICT